LSYRTVPFRGCKYAKYYCLYFMERA
jgi:hypothetical protein